MVKAVSLIFLFFAAAVTAQAQDEETEIRKSIYFGGGSYAIDDYQVEELYHVAGVFSQPAGEI